MCLMNIKPKEKMNAQTLLDTKEIAYETAVFKAQILAQYGEALEEFSIFYEGLFDAVLLDVLFISEKYRKHGLGSEILRKTITFADDLGIDLVLEPDDCYGTPMRILNAFYAKHGGLKCKITYSVCGDKYTKKMFKWTAKTA